MSLTHDDFIAWKASPITREVFKLLEEEANDIQKQWSEGLFLTSDDQNAKQIGVIEGINKILYMEVEDGE